MKKIAINGRFLSKQPTGVDRFAHEILNAIDHLYSIKDAAIEGMQIEVFVPQAILGTRSYKHIPIIPIGRQCGNFWEQLDLPLAARGRLLINLCNTAPILAREQLVVIHDAATIRTPQSYGLLFRAWYRLMHSVLYRLSRSVCTVSEFSRVELSEIYGPRANIPVIPEGTDHMARIQSDDSVLERNGLRRKEYVLAVSSSAAHKNFSLVLRAMSILNDRSIFLAIAGGSNSKIFSDTTIEIDKNAKRLGYVSDMELKALYENAVCFVFPSYYEGYGLPPIEAMACGCPVIASSAASIPEVCQDAALYFDPFDSIALSESIRKLTAESGLQSELRRRGTLRAKELTWDISARSILDEIRRISK